jgi:hypothetical protein
VHDVALRLEVLRDEHGVRAVLPQPHVQAVQGLEIEAARRDTSTGPSSMDGPVLRSLRRAMNAACPITAPATQSLVPFTYLVRLWITTSAPWRSGVSSIGLNVLRTTERHAVGMCEVGECRQVRDLEQRIAHALDEQALAVRRPIARRTRCGVGRIDERRQDPEARQQVAEQCVRAAVERARRHDMIAPATAAS